MGDVILDDSGRVVNRAPLGSYMLPIRVRQTGATAAPATVWAVRNGTTKRMFIRRIHVMAAFDGTGAASSSDYQLRRFTAATPTGGAALTAIKKRSSDPASGIADARVLDTGLTTAGVSFETAMAQFGAPRQVAAANEFPMILDFGALAGRISPIELAANEGICIQTGVASVIGDSLIGWMEWDEHLL